MNYQAATGRYEKMQYRRCGKSGILLPAISLGLWQNFGEAEDLSKCRDIVLTAFDNGITHFDLANNYGPPPGSAETTFGKILQQDLVPYRDDLIISSKAGFYMSPGPYGEWGSKKHLVSSLDQSLQRMGLDYVDIFYHHRPDPDTPLEETMMALDLLVRQGKALYAGISNYPAGKTAEAISLLRKLGTPCLIHQPRYSMLDRWVEKPDPVNGKNLLQVLEEEGVGSIVFSPLAQGLLTDKYLKGIPADSRVGRKLPNGAMTADKLEETILQKVASLNQLAMQRGQSLAQMAIAWLLKDKRVTSVLVGASSAKQLLNSAVAVHQSEFSDAELQAIAGILTGQSQTAQDN